MDFFPSLNEAGILGISGIFFFHIVLFILVWSWSKIQMVETLKKRIFTTFFIIAGIDAALFTMILFLGFIVFKLSNPNVS